MKSKTSDSLLILPAADRQRDDAATSSTVSRRACATLRTAVQVTMLVPLLAGCVYASERPGDWVRQIEMANALIESGDLHEAHRLYTRALEDAQTAGDEVRAGVVLQNVGRLLDRMGQLREAEKAYLRAVSAFDRAGVTDERLVVRAYVGLSAVYIQTGQYSKAERLIRRVLADSSVGADSDRASLMGSLGVILAHRHEFAEAERVLQQTAELTAGGHSTEMQEVRAVAIANVAGIQMRRGRTAEAVRSYRLALLIMDAQPNASPTTLTVALADYANLLDGLGSHEAANDLYTRAISIAESRLGPTHPILGGLLQKYSELLRRSGKRSEARAAAHTARRISDESRRENLTGHTIPIEALMVSK